MITMISLCVIITSGIFWFFKEPQNQSKKVTSMKSHYFLQQDIAEEREAERKARVAEVQAQRQAEREAKKLVKIQERQAREASLISKYLSSDRSKKLGLTEKDITITYVTETVTYKNGSQKTITYPKVVRI